MKIIQIDGFRGLITAVFMAVCLVAGFVAFPGLVAMHLWNKYLVALYMFPMLNLFQGILLWGIIAITYCIVSKKGLAVSFKETPELSDRELDMIMKKARIQSQINKVNKIIQKSDCFEKSNNNMLTSASADKDLSHISSPLAENNNTKPSAERKEDETLSNLK